MIQIYNLLSSNMKKVSLTNLEYLLPDICTIIKSNNIFDELNKAQFIEWDSKRYNKKRIDNLSTDEFDMYTISWLPEQKSSIHDHPQNGCIMYLISGTLEEKIYNKKLELIETKIIKGPYIGYIHDSIGFHSIQCIDKAIALHIYSPGKYKPFLMSV